MVGNEVNTEQKSDQLSSILSAQCHPVDASHSSLSSSVLFRIVRWSLTTRRVTAATHWTATFSATPATWSTSSLAAPLPSPPPPSNTPVGEGGHLVDVINNCQRVTWTAGAEMYNSCCRGLIDLMPQIILWLDVYLDGSYNEVFIM